MGVASDIIGVGLPPIIGGEIAGQPMDHLRIPLLASGRHDGAGIKPTANTDIVGALVTGPDACRDIAEEHREQADKSESWHRTVLIPDEAWRGVWDKDILYIILNQLYFLVLK
jgi:hypothetical protein